MVHGKKLLLSSLFAATSCITFQNASNALPVVETGDAGQTLATAQKAGAATGFIGTLGAAQDADLYMFTIAAGTYTFSDVSAASLDTTAGGQLDSAIFLFNSAGAAVVTNDDADAADVTSQFTVTLTGGTYYFGISESGNEPVNSANQLLFAGYPGGDTTATRGPASLVNPTTEATFNGNSYTSDLGTYNVTISSVPEPSTFAAFALGGVAAGFAFLRRRA